MFRDDRVISKDAVAERIRKVAQLLHDVLKRHGKQLILQDFFHEPVEMDALKTSLARLPDDLIVMNKDTTHEFHPFYSWDPLHGQAGKKRQIIEIDLGVEKALSGRGLYAQTGYIRRVAARAGATSGAAPKRTRRSRKNSTIPARKPSPRSLPGRTRSSRKCSRASTRIVLEDAFHRSNEGNKGFRETGMPYSMRSLPDSLQR